MTIPLELPAYRSYYLMGTNTYAHEFIGEDGKKYLSTDSGVVPVVEYEVPDARPKLIHDVSVHVPLIDNQLIGGGDSIAPWDRPIPLTIDTETGVLSPLETPLTFRTITEAEQFIEKIAGQEESLKLLQCKALIAVRDQQLFKQKPDQESGENFTSFDAYLKDLCHRMVALDGNKPRSIKDWMLKVRMLGDQLIESDGDILRMGYHATIALTAAARDRQQIFLIENEDLNNGGGMRLGRNAFAQVYSELKDSVFRAQDDPSFSWDIASTHDLIDGILNKQSTKVGRQIEASFIGADKVKVKGITWFVQEAPVHVDDTITLAEFRLLAGGDEVVGLGDQWR